MHSTSSFSLMERGYLRMVASIFASPLAVKLFWIDAAIQTPGLTMFESSLSPLQPFFGI